MRCDTEHLKSVLKTGESQLASLLTPEGFYFSGAVHLSQVLMYEVLEGGTLICNIASIHENKAVVEGVVASPPLGRVTQALIQDPICVDQHVDCL